MTTSITGNTMARISRGVNILVADAKRGPVGFVFLSKKRTAELNALKTSPFYQGLTLVESRDDKTVFRTKLAGINDRDTFIKEATEAAHAVGVGVGVGVEDSKTVKATKVAKKAETV